MFDAEKLEVPHLLHMSLLKMAETPDHETDVRLILQILAGVIVESCTMFEDPTDALSGLMIKICAVLQTDAYEGPLPDWLIMDGVQIDTYVEHGRELCRMALHDWQDGDFSFIEMVVMLTNQIIASWEPEGIPRCESFRLLYDYSIMGLCFEIAAQELCDVLIEKKMGRDGWSLGDCLGGLSGAAGWRLAKLGLLRNKIDKRTFPPNPMNKELEDIVRVMTAEAVRMGVPAGSDWQFGIAANDTPLDPPVELLEGVEPYAQLFFSATPLRNERDQAVACAKAAGRMLAVVSTGEQPEIAHVIAKPLAMMAITETYHAFWVGF